MYFFGKQTKMRLSYNLNLFFSNLKGDDRPKSAHFDPSTKETFKDTANLVEESTNNEI